jgi:hypothetical protein
MTGNSEHPQPAIHSSHRETFIHLFFSRLNMMRCFLTLMSDETEDTAMRRGRYTRCASGEDDLPTQ